MRIMLDTNVLLSALLFPGERMNVMMQCIFEQHRLVLSSLIVEDVDVFITGDKDFSEVEIERPEILTPSEFIERYV